MSNHNEMDNEKQFLSDIEKATALSLETLALEQFKRTKIQYSSNDLTTTNIGNNKNNSHNNVNLQDYHKILKLRQQSLEISSTKSLSATTTPTTPSDIFNKRSMIIAPPPIVPPRRNSEIKYYSALPVKQQQQQLKQEQEQQPDLISFTSPTNNDKSHTNFVQFVDEIHKLNVRAHSMDSQQLYTTNNIINNLNNNNNLNNLNNNNNNSMFPSYGFQQQQHPHNLPTSNSISGGISSGIGSMQIVPYTTTIPTINNQYSNQIEQQQQNTKIPLTSEQLSQLYNMNVGYGGIQQRNLMAQQQQQQQQQLHQQQQQLYQHHFLTGTSSLPSSSSSSISLTTDLTRKTMPNNFMSSFQPQQIPLATTPLSAGLVGVPIYNSPYNMQQQQQLSQPPQQPPPILNNDERRSFTPSPPPPLPSTVPPPTSTSSNIIGPTFPIKVNTEIHLPQQQQRGLPKKQLSGPSYSSTSSGKFARDLSPSNTNTAILNTLAQSTSAPSFQSSTSLNDVILRRNTGGDLIDLDHGIEDNSRVSVLEAFDPLLISEQYDDKDDTASEYYSEYDPFDYLYSGGTQYSDPVYDAVNKTDKNALSPSNSVPPIGWNIQTIQSTSSTPTHSSIYSVDDINKIPPPLPPRNSAESTSSLYFETTDDNTNDLLDRRKRQTKLYENVLIKKNYDPELVSFYKMVLNIRSRYKYNDKITNIGHVVASEFPNNYPDETSIKLLVHPKIDSLKNVTNCSNYTDINNVEGGSGSCNGGVNGGNSFSNNGKGQIEGYGPPVVFTCDINTTVEHVIMHVVCSLEGKILGSVDEFMLKPIGVIEWLSPTSKLNQLECVHNSIKLEKDVQLGLCPKNELNLSAIGRTQQDDLRDAEIKLEDILAHEPVSSMGYDNLMIILETLETEIDRLESSSSDVNPHTVLSCSGVSQAVKAICALLGAVETLEISHAIYTLKEVCSHGKSYSRETSIYGGSKLNILSETGDYAEVQLRPKTFPEQVRHRCNQVRVAIQQLLELYSNAFRVDFCLNLPEFKSPPKSLSHVTQPVMIHIVCLHRIPPNWKYDDYLLGTQIYHGTRYIGNAIVAQCTNENTGTYPRLKFDSRLTFESIPVCTLPRESRLIFVLYGCSVEPAEGDSKDTSNEANQERKVTKIELGWCSIQFFDFARTMVQGPYLLSLWPPTTDKFLGPAPAKGTHPHGDLYPILGIEIFNYGGHIVFPEALQNTPSAPKLDFNSLDNNLQQELIDTAEQGYPGAVDKREVLWEKRYYLQCFPHALPKVLHAAHSWDFASLVDLHALIKSWKSLTPLQAMELFLPRYPDLEVRSYAVKWFSVISNDQFVDYLPQLIQALKHDTYEASPMAEMLLCRSLESPRIAHHLYWLLVHSLPGDSPQNTLEFSQSNDVIDEALITQARYHRRNQMLLRALLAICGEKLSAKFLAQNMICKSLADVANNVKQSKESLRQVTLVQGLESVHQILLERPTSLPLGPGLEVTGVNSRTSSYFNSNTLPLKINFFGPDAELLPAIFKCGDDLQQDMLTLQLVRIMDKLWLKEGLDLKMVTFNCIPTGYKKGMIELVSDAETLRKIQVEWGLTGSFKDKPIAEWLARQNPSQLEYQRAVSNFTVSCAGYSVVTYILGICDRHNDNIMLKTSGHLFHIDFGKFLGDAQMFGNFKRDRTPFVLTSDMAYVINGGDKPSTKFHHFVDLCCKAFNIVRKHGDLILHMLALMATSGIPGVTADAVTYVRKALLPGQSNPEAAASFAKMIQFSLKSWFTQFNFFLHNLAQIRFTADEAAGELLSFVPRTYTMAQDGRLKSVTVHGNQKRYDLEKYYTYILKVTRQNQPDPAYLFRSYKEFLEFHQKLCIHYPLARLHSLQSGIYVGRSNIKTVADKRLPEIQHFLISLFNSADEIAHSNLVYTFFHPLLRDQQEADIHVKKVKDKKVTNPHETVNGMIKLSLQYHRGALTVMVHHARSLQITNGQEPNTYVKCYLKPDPTKATKRKTKVIKKNCFPSFMETLEYRMPLEIIINRILEVTVWSHDSLHENEFLGGVRLPLANYDLREEILEWFTLNYLPRT